MFMTLKYNLHHHLECHVRVKWFIPNAENFKKKKFLLTAWYKLGNYVRWLSFSLHLFYENTLCSENNKQQSTLRTLNFTFNLLPVTQMSACTEKNYTQLFFFLHSHVVAGIIKSAADSHFCWQLRISDKLRMSALQGTVVQSGCNWNHVCRFSTWCFHDCWKTGWSGAGWGFGTATWQTDW